MKLLNVTPKLYRGGVKTEADRNFPGVGEVPLLRTPAGTRPPVNARPGRRRWLPIVLVLVAIPLAIATIEPSPTTREPPSSAATPSLTEAAPTAQPILSQ